ncbi:MAG: serine/threonine-protein kinase [Myxococcales bacterium]|nr:serine/threonine-protein kinase [Myxococcales bacterium]
MAAIKANSRLGKYRILRRVGQGGFATVYRARDTIEGIDVALKVPNTMLEGDGGAPGVLDELRREVRITAKMDHPNVLPMKNAEVIDGHFVITYPLGVETLADRLQRRVSAVTALRFAEQAMEAVAYAHGQRIIHCDIKPDNFILFPGERLRLGDFGIARVAMKRLTLASGQGTVGYLAPDQALGRPSFRSDVFSLGLVIYRMFSGVLPMWPYDWPPAGIGRARSKLSPQMIAILERCLRIDDRRRFADGGALLVAYRRICAEALKPAYRRQGIQRVRTRGDKDSRSQRQREFVRRYGRALETRGRCSGCKGPISESMCHCPWCRRPISVYRGPHRFGRPCPRCGRSLKGDWTYCGYCYGAGVQTPGTRRYSDRRYKSRCKHCAGPLMAHMRYCSRCRRRTSDRWKLPEGGSPCARCGWEVTREYWDTCPWCGKGLAR